MDFTSIANQLLSGADLSGGPNMVKALVAALVLNVSCRIAAEALTRLSAHSDSKWEGKAARILSTISWGLGSFLGKFGVGIPGAVLEDHVDQAVQAIQDAEKAAPPSNDAPKS